MLQSIVSCHVLAYYSTAKHIQGLQRHLEAESQRTVHYEYMALAKRTHMVVCFFLVLNYFQCLTILYTYICIYIHADLIYYIYYDISHSLSLSIYIYIYIYILTRKDYGFVLGCQNLDRNVANYPRCSPATF